MNYIIFDLEWNQAAQKQLEDPDLTFEIIEIGAVKMSEDGKILGEFQRLIRPIVYKELFYRTREVVNISEEELEQGTSFVDACSEFLEWCGEEYCFCTWGSMDLTELQKNMDYYHMENPFPLPLYYYDVQKLYSLDFEDGKMRRSLEYAIQQLLIIQDQPFHRALSDAYYTAMILLSLDWERLKKMVSIDYHQVPKTRKDEIYIVFDHYSKFVSREFASKEEAMEDKGVTSTVCYKCRRSVRRKLQWFSDCGRNYYSLSYCPIHGWMKGKIRMKKTKEQHVFAVKTLKLIDADEAKGIVQRKEGVQNRRREKKKHE
ncbi:MAG: exonuclease domain-containing protein [Clostridiales bacterium]|nr:exonuclease domain-containing protein [Clostridiales bacterium]